LHGSKLLNIFGTESEKPRRLAELLKIFFSTTVNVTGIRGLFKGKLETTSCD
jgi:hypothetical protein